MSKLQKWWKPALAIVALVIVLQVGVSLLVRTHHVHAYLVAGLERAFGRPVEVTSFDARILPSPQLDASGCRRRRSILQKARGSMDHLRRPLR